MVRMRAIQTRLSPALVGGDLHTLDFMSKEHLSRAFEELVPPATGLR